MRQAYYAHKKEKTMAKKTETIYRVRFKTPPVQGDEQTEFFFTSLSAIYDVFTPEQIGCGVQRLWNVKITQESPYVGRLCEVRKETVRRKAQKRRSKEDVS